MKAIAMSLLKAPAAICLLLFALSAQAGFEEAKKAFRQGNYPVAIRELTPLAEAGNLAAQHNLALIYTKLGTAQDDQAAFGWYRRAAEADHPNSQHNLGYMYETGRGTAQDDKAAFNWYRKAAEHGLAEAQYSLGWMYSRGQGVARSNPDALAWYLKAAAQGHAGAQFNLGKIYDDGREGIVRNDREAIGWYRKAAAQKHYQALNNLGTVYEAGQGVAKNLIIAYALYALSVSENTSPDDQVARENLGRVARQLSPDQITRAQSLGKEMARPDNLLKALDDYARDSSAR